MGEGPTAALLQQIYEVDPLACPSCHAVMRIIACITQAAVINQILMSVPIEDCTEVPTEIAHSGRRLSV
jgi:hypothetical protein